VGPPFSGAFLRPKTILTGDSAGLHCLPAPGVFCRRNAEEARLPDPADAAVAEQCEGEAFEQVELLARRPAGCLVDDSDDDPKRSLFHEGVAERGARRRAGPQPLGPRRRAHVSRVEAAARGRRRRLAQIVGVHAFLLTSGCPRDRDRLHVAIDAIRVQARARIARSRQLRRFA